MTTLPRLLDDAARSSVDPDSVRLVFERLIEREGAAEIAARLDAGLVSRVAAVAAASRSLARLIVTDRDALSVLAATGEQDAIGRIATSEQIADPGELARLKRLAYLRIAADDLGGRSSLEQVGAELSRLADAVLSQAFLLASSEGHDASELALVAMGKHGACELNYASDVDVIFVATSEVSPERATAAARRVLAIASEAYRIDTDLRPEGRDGALVRTLASYRAYWERWARPWEFQALLKARPTAGDAGLGSAFADAAAATVWTQTLDSDALDELRSMKSRTEQLVARQGLSDRELKRGRGGIRDIEFALQLLQLVHGRADPQLRVSSTARALDELASAGYVDHDDATLLGLAYRFLRTVEHRLQLVEEAQVHTVPAAGPARDHLARVLGFAGGADRTDRFEHVLARYQATVRSIHERLFFRPLLEVFAGAEHGRFSEAAASERLGAFGFRDAERTRQALNELTRGLTRSSRLMQQLLPVLLGWLSESPDPDSGLLGLRNLAGLPHQRDVIVGAFRDSPELARRLCLVLGTSQRLGELAMHHPGIALRLGDDVELEPAAPIDLTERALIAADSDPSQASKGLRRIVGSETLRIAAGELLAVTPAASVAGQLSLLGDATLAASLQAVSPALPFGVVAMGRLGGSELSYGSDLDVLLVYDGSGAADAAEAERVATSMFRVLNGTTPSERIWTVDASLRPEGKQGPLARSFEAYAEYHERWIEAWERQALLRSRPVAGDEALLARFTSLVEATVWERPFTMADEREVRRLKARMERERIPAGEDPQFHLKLGRGSLADIEWTVQLLQLEHGVRSPNTAQAIEALTAAAALEPHEAQLFGEALAFLSATRARWHLVGNYVAGAGGPVTKLGSDSLPQTPHALARLARSLGERPAELRERYRRVTRRARRVVEERFYGL